MNLTKFSIDRPIGITMVIAFFVVLGLFSFYRIGVELLPALNTPYVTVSISYPGANADSVEQQVVKPAEDALSSVSNLKHMTSTASYGQARITLELDFSANADAAAIDATKKINAIRGSLPDGIDEPVVIKRDVNATPIMYVAVQSPTPWTISTARQKMISKMSSSRPMASRKSSSTAAVIRKSPSKSTRTSSSTTI